MVVGLYYDLQSKKAKKTDDGSSGTKVKSSKSTKQVPVIELEPIQLEPIIPDTQVTEKEVIPSKIGGLRRIKMKSKHKRRSSNMNVVQEGETIPDTRETTLIKHSSHVDTYVITPTEVSLANIVTVEAQTSDIPINIFDMDKNVIMGEDDSNKATKGFGGTFENLEFDEEETDFPDHMLMTMKQFKILNMKLNSIIKSQAILGVVILEEQKKTTRSKKVVAESSKKSVKEFTSTKSPKKVQIPEAEPIQPEIVVADTPSTQKEIIPTKTGVSHQGVIFHEIPAPASPSSKKRRETDKAKYISKKKKKGRVNISSESTADENETIPKTLEADL
ncbi:unnamed protein product [Lactuca saligna]|uniref:Uncharacterized protein n=1 Tax=Lactuca saligna TaxID=75948 RepID=A0AA35VWR1_LACSI|nr:unnamed protein product [Lactuca saligna]